MIGLLETNKKAIAAICQKYGVKKLDVFGSAATGAFDHATSDLDFVVEFADYGPGIAARFIGFADELEHFFGRSVDLVFDAKLTNPYFRQSVNATRELIFDASRNSETVA
jgi:predicted nucleotidyltransferase